MKITPENTAKKESLMAKAQESASKSKKKGGSKQSGSTTPAAAKGGDKGGADKTGSATTAGSTTPVGTSGGGRRQSESANTSRASTPVSEGRGAGKAGKRRLREVEDDEKSTSSKDEDLATTTSTTGTPATPGGGPVASAIASGRRSSTSSQSTSRSRRAAEAAAAAAAAAADVDDDREPPAKTARFSVVVPEELSYVLASDMELVTASKHLFNIPAKAPAAAVVADYLKYAERLVPDRWLLHAEAMEGVLMIFDAKLGKELLYKVEKKQYSKACKKTQDMRPSDLYGSAHLLRLMVKLERYLNEDICVDLERDVRDIKGVVEEFLVYLDNNRGKYFSSKNYSAVQSE